MTVQSVNTAAVQSPVQVSVSPVVKGFLGDVVDETKKQLGTNVNRALHPIDTSKRVAHLVDETPRQIVTNLFKPYKDAIKSGHTGKAVGHLLANVVSVGAVVLGGRFLLNKAGLLPSGGASVGYGSPLSRVFDLVAAPFKFVGGLLGKAFGFLKGGVHAGGAGVGF